jgi:hypothetical protein
MHPFKSLYALTAVMLCVSACVGIELSPSGIPRQKIYGNRLGVEWISVSPDGNKVEIAYKDRSKEMSYGYAVYDIRTDTITRTYKTNDWSYQKQPGTDFRAAAWSRPKTFGLESGVAIKHDGKVKRLLLEPEQGFRHLAWPSFVSPNEVIFTASTPLNEERKKEAEALGAGKFDSLAYRMRLGQKPVLIKELREFAIAQNERLAVKPLFIGISNAVASPTGKIVFFGMNLNEPKDSAGKFNYEVFMLENGKVTQLTDLKSHMARLTISQNGKTVAFGTDSTRTASWDLGIFDLKTKELRVVKLAERFEKLPEFNQ